MSTHESSKEGLYKLAEAQYSAMELLDSFSCTLYLAKI